MKEHIRAANLGLADRTIEQDAKILMLEGVVRTLCEPLGEPKISSTQNNIDKLANGDENPRLKLAAKDVLYKFLK